MPARYRLTRADWKLLSGVPSRRVRGRYGVLTITPLSLGKGPLFACVVSKKAARKAHERHLVRRRAREIIRPLMPHIIDRVAIVLYANKEGIEASFDQLARDIRILLEDAKLIQ